MDEVCHALASEYPALVRDACYREGGQSVRPPTGSVLGRRRKFLPLSILGKFVRSPRNLCRALCATAFDVMERGCPGLRPRIFVVARKVKESTVDDILDRKANA